MNVLKVGGNATVIFEDGRVIAIPDCSDELFVELATGDYTFEEVAEMSNPDYVHTVKLREFIEEDSSLLALRGSSVVMPSVSQLSIPEDFVEKFVAAEIDCDDDLITTYTNFWTLVSLNPDSRVRDNLFWFIRKWGMHITKSGLIVAYRNADVKSQGTEFNLELTRVIVSEREKIKHVFKKSPKDYAVIKKEESYEVKKCDSCCSVDAEVVGNLEKLYQDLINGKTGVTTFTDHHSHTFTIRIGEPVKMPREKVDCSQDRTCSAGLHVASKGWLKQNYYGSVGLKVLVNPAFVCSVPPEDSYGKMRVCEYLPIGTITFDENGDVVDNITTDGYEDEYFQHICYEGDINNEDKDNYTIAVPENMVEVDKDKAWENLRRIASSLRCEK